MKVALLGAECTGKTTLSTALSAALAGRGRSAHVVTEALREWCDQQGRTPHIHEQRAIAHIQAQRVLCAPSCDVVLADTTPLMTAVYSDVIFGDRSLYSFALAHHAVYDVSLLLGLDLPWVSDGIQRSGARMQSQIDTRLRQVLQTHGLRFSVVYGPNAQRCACAMQAIAHASAYPEHSPPTTSDGPQRWQWVCGKCSDAACEHALFSALRPSDVG